METDDRPDWTLVDAVRAGNHRAFDALMERYKRRVLNFVYRMTGHAAEAQDLAQDVFVRAYRGMLQPTFRPRGGEFSTWLFQIARNAALDGVRRRKRHPSESLDAMDSGGRSLPDRGRSAAEQVIATETGRHIAEAIALLPDEQRAAVILSEYEGLSVAQIGAILKRSEKSVEGLLYRARRCLRERLAHLLE